MNIESGPDSQTGIDMPHVLWRDTMKNPNNCPPLDIGVSPVVADSNTVEGTASPGSASQGYEMVPNHVRLTRFKVKETSSGSGVFDVYTYLSYGDSDLLNAPDANGVANCIGGTGNQCCGSSSLQTTVKRRLQ